jgi:hypothetical protein
MPRINEKTDTDPCLISLLESCRGMLAEPAPYLIRGTSLKVIYPVRKSFSNGVERLQHLGWKRGRYFALSSGVCPKLPRPLRERVGVRGGNCKGRRHFKEGGERRNTEKINPFFLLDV